MASAIAPDGTTIAVWQRYDEANWVAQGAVRNPGAAAFGNPDHDQRTRLRRLRSLEGSDFVLQAAVRAAGSTTFDAPITLTDPYPVW